MIEDQNNNDIEQVDEQVGTDADTMDAAAPESGDDAAPVASATPAEPADEDGASAAEGVDDDGEIDEGDTFERAYVEDLRRESANYRTQLRSVQEQLHRVLVEQTGLLADPADLSFDVAHLDDPEALGAAIDALIAQKPHLKARRFDPAAAAQGPKVSGGGDVNLIDIMRSRI